MTVAELQRRMYAAGERARRRQQERLRQQLERCEEQRRHTLLRNFLDGFCTHRIQ